MGRTTIKTIRINGSEAEWERVENQLDIIKVIYDSKNKAYNTLTLALDYQVLIPDGKFTGYGYDAKGDTLLRYWYIALSPIYDNQWKNYSHLNLDDYSIQAAEYYLKLTVPEGITAQTNLQKNKVEDGVHYFSGQHIREVSLYFSNDNPFQTFKTTEDRVILTDVFKKNKKKEVNLAKVKLID